MSRCVVMVTGASGFIGSHTLEPLRYAGFEVHAFGRAAPPDSKADYHAGDFLERTHVQVALDRIAPTHILHCAWGVNHGTFWHDPGNLDWVAATLHFARAALSRGVKRFVGIGTCTEYDWSDNGITPRKEEDTTAPHELYGISKDCTRRALEALFASNDCSFAWARMFHLFGRGEHHDRFVPSLALALKEGRPATCRHGQLVRDYLSVADAGGALAKIVSSDATGAINVASGQGMTLGQVAQQIGGLSERSDLLRIENHTSNDSHGMIADIKRLRTDIGFLPRMQTTERLSQYIKELYANLMYLSCSAMVVI